MKKILILSFLTLFIACLFTQDAQAQHRRKKKKKSSSKVEKYFDESGNFFSKVYYGAGLNLNWQQGAIISGGIPLNTSTFLFGISPMAGYKFTERLSAGPRIEFFYQGTRIQAAPNSNEDLKLNSVNFGLGVFGRFKINQTYFIHAEYQNINEETPTGVINFQSNEIETTRSWTTNYYAGVGYTSGGLVGVEAYLLWNFAQEFTSENIPIYYRFGLNYKF
ncbi:MAG: hypothetical protein D6714_02755 [Bacteroidetes bacterium]|nr:MAG: hypothetical protein D6714_02755 [Bacteroidota bacterium]